MSLLNRLQAARHLAEEFARWCSERIGPDGATGWVYFIGQPGTEADYCKIGYTADLEKRYQNVLTCNADADLLVAAQGSLALERALHERFAALRHRGEWFRLDGELFDLIEALVRCSPPEGVGIAYAAGLTQ